MSEIHYERAESLPYINDTSSPAQGVMRCIHGVVSIWDSNTDSWIQTDLGQRLAFGGLTPDAISAIKWAITQQEQELAFKIKAETSAAVQIALDNLENAKKQLAITAALS